MTDWTMIAKLAGMLGSTHDGEILAAVRQLDRVLKAQGLTWGDFANRVKGGTAVRDPFDIFTDIMRKARENDRSRRDEEERARQHAARNRGEW